MQQSTKLAPTIDNELNPYVGKMASRLMRSFTSDMDSDRWVLVTEILGFAAEAEQKLGEQKVRINQLESLASTDELTGLANRRGMEDFMKKSLANARRYNETGCLAYIDLDHFKLINDTWGHDAGDAVLQRVARLLTDNVRASDLVARVGGDEFVIILSRCALDGGQARLAKIQKKLDAATVRFHGHKIHMGGSIGLTTFNKTTRLEDLLKAADANMYANKRARAPRH